MTSNRIKMFFQRGKCNGSMTPRDFAQFEVAWTVEGVQVWCWRHECNVVTLEFGAQEMSYARDDENLLWPTDSHCEPQSATRPSGGTR